MRATQAPSETLLGGQHTSFYGWYHRAGDRLNNLRWLIARHAFMKAMPTMDAINNENVIDTIG
jgi:hypothetical protein